jgi:hypothetical protein
LHDFWFTLEKSKGHFDRLTEREVARGIVRASIILAAGGLPADLASAVGSSNPLRVSSNPTSTFIEEILVLEQRAADLVIVAHSKTNAPPAWLGVRHESVKFIEVDSFSQSIAATLTQTLSYLPQEVQSIRVQYADTLGSLAGIDRIGVGQAFSDEDWAFAPVDFALRTIDPRKTEANQPAITGQFSFGNPSLLRLALLEALSSEDQSRPLDPFYLAIKIYAQRNKSSLTAHEDNSWRDVGHYETFFQKRLESLRGRDFNSFSTEMPGYITKKSSNPEKLAAEASWFLGVPAEFFRYLPTVVSVGADSYGIKYVAGYTVAESLLYGETSKVDWEWMLSQVEQWITDSGRVTSQGQVSKEWFLNSFSDRLGKLVEGMGHVGSSGPCLSKLIREKQSVIHGAIVLSSRGLGASSNTLVHGDLVFSNIIANPLTKKFKLIDPRGGFHETSIFGPPLYDWAKLAQCIYGNYDEIVAGQFSFNQDLRLPLEFPEDSDRTANFDKLRGWFELKCPDPELAKLTAGLLLLTAAPLHSDSRDRMLALVKSGIDLMEKSS